ncbi:hypothetical protein D3C73_1015080 [compost metagenome]
MSPTTGIKASSRIHDIVVEGLRFSIKIPRPMEMTVNVEKTLTMVPTVLPNKPKPK